MKIPERFVWALEVLDVQPADQMLEIGCGTGVLAKQIAQKLQEGHLLALDKSDSMILKAMQQQRVDDDKLSFLIEHFKNFRSNGVLFDKILAFNVNVFWQNPEQELKLIYDLLKPEGRFFLFNQPPTDKSEELAALATHQLLKEGFEVEKTIYRQLHPEKAFCIISKKTAQQKAK